MKSMNRLFLPSVLLLIISLFTVFEGNAYALGVNEDITSSSTVNSGTEKIRDRSTYMFDEKNKQVTIRTNRISFVTGMQKINEYNFTDPSLLPSYYEFDSTNGFNHQDGVVVDTPKGIKAYTVAVQSTLKGKSGVNIIYEFDYSNLTLRKIKEIPTQKSVQLDAAQLGLYSVESDKEGIQYFSLENNKQMLSGGKLITSKDVTDTRFSLSPAPASQTFGVYCPKYQYTSCYNIEFGGAKGKAVKVTKNNVIEDARQASSKSFMAGGTKIKWNQSSFQMNTPYQWNVTATRNGKTVSLFNGKAYELDTFVSPGGKYLVINADPSYHFKRTQASTIYVYDLKTMVQVQKYKSSYNTNVTGIQWLSDDLYIMEYYFSNPGAYPPSFYYIPEGKHFKIEYSQYQDWANYLDSFTYDDLFFLTLPVAVTSGEGVLHYEGQPTFYMNGLYYVPLKEFMNAFHVQVEEKDKTYLFKRLDRTSKLALSQSKRLIVKGKVFLPLGQWNKELGLKVAQVGMHSMSYEILISDELRKTEAAMKAEIPGFQAILKRLKKSEDGSGGFIATEKPFTQKNSDHASLRGVTAVLNHNRSLSFRFSPFVSYGESLQIYITSRDSSKVLMELPIKITGNEYTTAALPERVFEEGILTFAFPDSDNEHLEHSHLGFTLKLPEFSKNRL